MDLIKCNDCKKILPESDIIITVNSQGEWVLHCNKCNSDALELAYELMEVYDSEK